jgi:predicted ABC-type ATPase
MHVVAGPNGAGKSTLTSRARHLLGLDPIDADTIQRETGMKSGDAWAEGLRRCRKAIEDRTSFLIETTLAGRDREQPSTYLRLMEEAKMRGFRVDLTFIALENADAHVARVADRVASGLHDIPEHVIRERYDRSLERAANALSIADHALLIDNSSADTPFRVVAELDDGRIAGDDREFGWITGFRWADTVLESFLRAQGRIS